MADEPKREYGPDDELPLEAELLPPKGEEAEEEEAETGASRPTGTALDVRPGREVLMPLDASQVIQGMDAYQELLPKLLKDSDWQKSGSDKFVKKSGWRKIARAFNLSVTLPNGEAVIERDGEGTPLRARALARATAPNGQTQDGDGYCSADESRFKSEKGRAKLEHDMAATATTRAKNRAISDLVGMGAVSAEEADIPSGGIGMAKASKQQCGTLSTALMWLFDGDEKEAEQAWNVLQRALGIDHMLGPVADGVTAIIAARKKHVEAKEAEAEKERKQ